MTFRFLSLLAGIVGLVACATGPDLDLTGVDRTLTPARAAADIKAARNQRVLWGGVLVQARNLKDATQLEVLGYPVDGKGKPKRNEPPQHRFLATHKGYLETADYAPGRMVTVVGTVTGTEEGKVGEARYVYPVVAAEQVYLWPREEERRGSTDPQIHFGVGVIFGR